jgi:transcriptional regulator with XRE-family HTH domain
MKDRIMEFLKAENKSSAQMAEEIGVQPSGISHILSGRNNPSLDFVIKMLERYKYLSTDWLLFGRGSMYKDDKIKTLFDENINSFKPIKELDNVIDTEKNSSETRDIKRRNDLFESALSEKNKESAVVKIVWFFSDNKFEEYYPRG